MFKRLICGISLICTLAVQLPAANILIFEDFALDASAIPGALALSGACGLCQTETDSGAFNLALTGGTWDLVIYAEQDGNTFSNSVAELTAYLASGGRMIGQTWMTGGLDALLEGSGVSANGTEITTDADPVFAGLGPTISLTSPGWGTFSRGWNPVGGGVGLGSITGGGSAIIRGNGGRTYLNAALTDTYSPLADGERLLANEINDLLGSTGTPVPEPSSIGLAGLGLFALAFMRRRK